MPLELSPTTVAYAVCLAMAAAAVMSILPGVRATSRGVAANLRALDARTGPRLGWLWTSLVVTQVAVTVAVLPLAAYIAWQVVRMKT
jgi:hypothetical protein